MRLKTHKHSIKRQVCFQIPNDWRYRQGNSMTKEMNKEKPWTALWDKGKYLRLTDFISVHRIHTIFISQRSAVNNSQKRRILTYRHPINAWLVENMPTIIKFGNCSIIPISTAIYGHSMTGLLTEEFYVLFGDALGWLRKNISHYSTKRQT